MKKAVSIFLAVFCLFGLLSCAHTPEPEYAFTVAYASYVDYRILSKAASNADLLADQQLTHFPVFVMDTYEDLQLFMAKYDGILSMDQGHDDILSVNDALEKAQFDREVFFEENSLLVVYAPSKNASFRYEIKDIKNNDGNMCVTLEEKALSKGLADVRAGWMFFVELDDQEANSCQSFDAIIDRKGE